MNTLEQKLQEITEGLGLHHKHQICYDGFCPTFEIELRAKGSTCKSQSWFGSISGRLKDNDNWTIKLTGVSSFPGTSDPDVAQAVVDFYQDLTSLLRELQSKEPEIYQATPGPDPE